jgi:hypothetical protein
VCIHRGKLRQIVVMQCKYGHDHRTEAVKAATDNVMPNQPLHLTAARLRIGMKLKRHGWAAAGERQRWAGRLIAQDFVVWYK